MLKPLFPSFNVATLHMARLVNPRGWNVSRKAPSSLAELKRRSRRDGVITVSSLHSERTIYGDPEVNFAARAWHDACHVLANAGFDDAGERAVCRLQQAQLALVYGVDTSLLFRRIVWAEVVGQLQFKARHGAFPVDQRAFVLNYLNNDRPADGDVWWYMNHAEEVFHAREVSRAG